MKDVVGQARKIAIPTIEEEAKIKELADELLGLVKKEAAKFKEVTLVEFGGSYAKGTWLKGKLDLDIFVKIKKDIDERRFEEIGKKIGFASLKKYKPYVRYSEHPYVEANARGTKVNVVPCYDVELGQWKSAADRSSFHTKFIAKNLDSEKKAEVRLLKKFLGGVGIYGAEIAKEGFSGYVSEVLIYHYGNFRKVIEAVSCLTQGQIIGNPTKKFESTLVVIDPIDSNRNLGTAISSQNVGRFILASRSFLHKPSLVFFTGKKLTSKGNNLKNTIVIKFNYKSRSPDIIWGQTKRAATSLAGQLEHAGFQVLRKSAFTDERTEAAVLLLLQSSTISKYMVKKGPEIFRKKESEQFIAKNSKNMLTWIDDDGRLLSLQEREFWDAPKFLRHILSRNLVNIGVPRGVIPDIKRGFSVLDGSKIASKSIKEALVDVTSTNELDFGSHK